MADHVFGSSDEFPYNISVDVGGVTFTGPGAETREEADALAMTVENSTGIEVEVFER